MHDPHQQSSFQLARPVAHYYGSGKGIDKAFWSLKLRAFDKEDHERSLLPAPSGGPTRQSDSALSDARDSNVGGFVLQSLDAILIRGRATLIAQWL